MKKILFSILVLAGITATAQVKVGTNPTTIDNASMLELEGTTKGFLPTRMTTAQRDAIASPPKGLVLYNTTLDCLQINKGTAPSPTWECIGASAAPTATADCNASGFNGTYVSGTALSGQTYTVTVVNSSLSPVSIAMQSSDLVLSGVLGVAVGTVSPATLNVPAGGSGIVTYNLTGNPTSCGTLTGVWTKISLTCTKTVGVSPSNFILPATSVTYNSLGEVSGFTANWTAQGGATGYTVEQSTSESGPWTAFASNPYTGTSAAVTGLAGNYAYWIRVTTIGGSCPGAVSISNGPYVGCAAKINATTWRILMCHNLGANPTLDPHTPVVGLQGAYIQWGRRGPSTTGDSRIDWQTAGNTVNFAAAPTAGNPNSGAIGGWSSIVAADFSWRTAGGVKTSNDPCPSGFRLLTNTEHIAISNNNTKTTTGTFNNTLSNFGAAVHYSGANGVINLTYPAAGSRSHVDGAAFNRALEASIWSSTESGGDASYNRQTNSTSEPNNIWNNAGVSNKQLGLNVRCIKE